MGYLLNVLRRSYDGDAWHGPALADVLAGVDAHTAIARPIDGAHTIWELTHHLGAWTGEVARRIGGAAPAEPPEGDWPASVHETDPAALPVAWDALRDRLFAARDTLLAAVAAFPPERLDDRVGTTPTGEAAKFVTFGEMIVGLAEHNAYHGGQIVLLRRALDAARPNAATITDRVVTMNAAAPSEAPARTRVKVCCMSNADEVRTAIAAGAGALGFVSAMPSGPGPIDETLIAELVATVPPPVSCFLLTCADDPDVIAAQVRRTGVDTVQLVDAIPNGAHAALRALLPQRVRLVQVIHVLDDDSVAEALGVAPHVDALLLDSGNPRLAVKELGGTGRVHDWSLSRAIVERAGVPVFLAGGLHAANVVDAVRTVRPFGVDVCSGVRSGGALDADRLAAFVRAVAGTDAPPGR